MSENSYKSGRFTYTEEDNIELLEPPCLSCFYQLKSNPMICEKYKFHKPNKVLLCESECTYYEKKIAEDE